VDDVAKIRVRAAEHQDAPVWLRLRCTLWPDAGDGEHRREIEEYLAGRASEPMAVFLAEDDEGRVVGLAELSIRPGAEGCETRGVAYLEGWFVEAAARRRGVGRALVLAAEEWGRSQGCREFASDTEAGNRISALAHQAVGFSTIGESGLLFRKVL
jgi:aminoglycoside 6'-N-acetyltransferase I